MLNKLMLWLSRLAALLLLLSFVVPYLAPTKFPKLSLASLAVSPLILINVLFLVYWLFRKWKKLFLSGFVLLLAYFHFGPFVEFSSEPDSSEYRNRISVLSYNVRLFNAYEADHDSLEVRKQIANLLKTEAPDVFCIQEYYELNSNLFDAYPYSHVYFRKDYKMGHAIFSKYPLTNKGSFDFEDSSNNTLYADVVVNNETIRVYNVHLQSHGILPNVAYLQDGDTDKLRTRMSAAFAKQENQVAEILQHKKTTPHKTILCGDLNNTPFSYIYRKVSKELDDAFLERGNGLGTTFQFDFYPMRIDYIFTSPGFDVLQFNTHTDSFSDHSPVSAVLGWPARSD